VVQGAVSETVPTRLPFIFESLGERKFKGFDQPTRVFSAQVKSGELVPEPEQPVVNDDETAAPDEPSVRSIIPETGKPSIAVLPFDNMSGDVTQEYFSDGISEDIITKEE
jgi:hypothetical protein